MTKLDDCLPVHPVCIIWPPGFPFVSFLTDVFAQSAVLNSTAMAAVFVSTELGPRVIWQRGIKRGSATVCGACRVTKPPCAVEVQ